MAPVAAPTRPAYRADLIDTWWRRRTDGWTAGVFCSLGGGEAVELVYNDGSGSSGLTVPTRILLKAFDRVRTESCRRCHTEAWRFVEKPGRHYVRHGCAVHRRAYLAEKRGAAKERARRSVRVGWWLHPFAKVLQRRSRKLLGPRGGKAAALGLLTKEARTATETGQWLLGAMFTMKANGETTESIAREVGIAPQDVDLCLAWVDAMAALHARALFGPSM